MLSAPGHTGNVQFFTSQTNSAIRIDSVNVSKWKLIGRLPERSCHYLHPQHYQQLQAVKGISLTLSLSSIPPSKAEKLQIQLFQSVQEGVQIKNELASVWMCFRQGKFKRQSVCFICVRETGGKVSESGVLLERERRESEREREKKTLPQTATFSYFKFLSINWLACFQFLDRANDF